MYIQSETDTRGSKRDISLA